LPGGDVPIVGVARNTLIHRAGRLSEMINLAMINRYVLVVGHAASRPRADPSQAPFICGA